MYRPTAILDRPTLHRRRAAADRRRLATEARGVLRELLRNLVRVAEDLDLARFQSDREEGDGCSQAAQGPHLDVEEVGGGEAGGVRLEERDVDRDVLRCREGAARISLEALDANPLPGMLVVAEAVGTGPTDGEATRGTRWDRD